MEKIKLFWGENKWFRTACWNLLNAIIAFLVTYFTNMPGEVSAVVLILLNFLTKYLNLKYLNDFGANKTIPLP